MDYKADISRLNAKGEGVAQMRDGAVCVPFTLPSERVEFALSAGSSAGRLSCRSGELLAIEKASAARCAPVCRYFGRCGGCLLQHWQAAPYQDWKRRQVFAAFAKAGIVLAEEQVAPLFSVKAATRRRLVLSAAVSGRGVTAGFNRYRSHEIIAVEECPVAEPALAAALPFIRRLSALLQPRREAFHITLTLAENGLDIALQGLGGLAEQEKLRLAKAVLNAPAAGAAVLRLTADEEIILAVGKPLVHFGAVAVELPAGGFLQAARSAEEDMARLAAQALQKCKNVADLFAGCGSFTFRLAENSNVHAVEQDKAALAALEQAAANNAAAAQAGQGSAGGGSAAPLKTISAERRDLWRQPLTHKELAAYDGLVFDPPRAGAEAQAREIAKSAVRHVVAVSCNPVTLARDVGILLAGGYALQSVTPLDQFLWSPHVEAVALLTKRPPKKRWVL